MDSKFSQTIYNEKSRVWSGQKKPLFNAGSIPLGKIVVDNLMKHPDRISQITYHNLKEYTNKQIATMSLQVAKHFKRLNAQQLDVIGICARNSDYVAPLFFGASLCGLPVSTLDPSFDKDGIKHIFSITQPTMLFCDGTEYKIIKEALSELSLDTIIYTMTKHIPGIPEITEFLQEDPNSSFKCEPLRNGADHLAVIVCSSGTTGLPKGVCISNEMLCNATTMNPAQTVLCFSTLYWSSGVNILVSASLYGAKRIINENGFSPEAFFEITRRYKVTMVLAPPSQLAATVNSKELESADLSSIRLYMCGGSALSYSLVEKFSPYIPNALFLVTYGMSECSGRGTCGIPSDENSVGPVMDNLEMAIVDEQGNRLGPFQTAEVWIKSVHKWPGYYNNAAETEKIYNKTGWLRSGDLGYMNENGILHIVGRTKEILKYNNFHFLPNEIDSVISELPGIAEVVACGIPDVASSFLPAALVVKSKGSKVTEKDIYEHVRARMAHFKQLRGGVYFVDELPKTASGKYIRMKAADICQRLRDNKIVVQSRL